MCIALIPHCIKLHAATFLFISNRVLFPKTRLYVCPPHPRSEVNKASMTYSQLAAE